MTRRVYKYPLAYDDQWHQLDAARVVLVDEQNGIPTVWAEVYDFTNNADGFEYRVFGTGQPLPDPGPRWAEHVGSYQAPPFVWHVYRRPVQAAP